MTSPSVQVAKPVSQTLVGIGARNNRAARIRALDAIAEIVVPFPSEKFHVLGRHAVMFRKQCRLDARIEVVHEVLAPHAQRSRVVRSDVEDRVNDEFVL